MTQFLKQKNINNLSKIVEPVWIFIKDLLIDFFKEIWRILGLFFLNIKNGKWSQKIATIIIILIFIVPSFISYYHSGNKFFTWINNKLHHEEILAEIQSNGYKSVSSFFDKYNKNYSVDCEWIRRVNVDEKMFLLHGTEKKTGNGCLTTEKYQIIPITMNPIQYDKSNQIERVNGKALMTIFDGGEIEKIEELQYNLWRKPEWKDENLWKFNPFSNHIQYNK